MSNPSLVLTYWTGGASIVDVILREEQNGRVIRKNGGVGWFEHATAAKPGKGAELLSVMEEGCQEVRKEPGLRAPKVGS